MSLRPTFGAVQAMMQVKVHGIGAAYDTTRMVGKKITWIFDEGVSLTAENARQRTDSCARS